MQNRPDKTALLEAVARFLATEVKPAVADPNLAFRVLVAANLAAVVAAEVATEEAQENAEIERLRELVPVAPAPFAGAAARKQALLDANRELVRRIDAGELDAAGRRRATDHVMLTLRGELFAQSPKFDASLEVES
ncbi:MAG TPA: DUF6285 domain-containing protein [Minicystis sp.]|nr:DUF6285 domain-containing protein [Minicystis sp.]